MTYLTPNEMLLPQYFSATRYCEIEAVKDEENFEKLVIIDEETKLTKKIIKIFDTFLDVIFSSTLATGIVFNGNLIFSSLNRGTPWTLRNSIHDIKKVMIFNVFIFGVTSILVIIQHGVKSHFPRPVDFSKGKKKFHQYRLHRLKAKLLRTQNRISSTTGLQERYLKKISAHYQSVLKKYDPS